VRTYYPQYGGGAVDVGKSRKDAGLTALLGLFLFDDHPDWIAGNYDQFVKPAPTRGNIAGILIGNEDPQMMDAITQDLGKAKADCAGTPVGTSQTQLLPRYVWPDSSEVSQPAGRGHREGVAHHLRPRRVTTVPRGNPNARDYLNRVMAWAQAQQVVVYLHNMFDDQFGVDTSSPFNSHFGLIDSSGHAKGVPF
jgi:exo-beta-1,3-glucanase (GH17 family)